MESTCSAGGARMRWRGGLRMAAPPALRAEVAPTYRVGFFLFLLVTVTLFVRPAELVASLEAMPIYQVLIIGCMAASLPAVWGLLRWSSLVERPGLVCVMGMVPAIVMSRLVWGKYIEAEAGASEFFKVLTYFILLMALVNTPKRLRVLMLVTAGCVLLTGVLATLRFNGILADPEGQARLSRGDGGIDSHTGEAIQFVQLRAVGIFSDPNDFSLVLVMAMLVVAFFMTRSKGWEQRLMWCVPMGALGYTFALTRSRGGFLSLMAGVVTWMVARYGWRRAVMIGVVVMPVIVVAFGGRQTNINLDANDTAQSRIRLWRDGIGFIASSPVFGVGHNMYNELTDNVAHNSYLHCYAELGVVGGTCFMGACLFPFMVLVSPGARRKMAALGAFVLPGRGVDTRGIVAVDAELGTMRCCVLAIGVAYAVGLFSLSRAYTGSTYAILGMMGAMAGLMVARNPAAAVRITPRTGMVLGIASVVSVAFLYVFVSVVLRVGG